MSYTDKAREWWKNVVGVGSDVPLQVLTFTKFLDECEEARLKEMVQPVHREPRKKDKPVIVDWPEGMGATLKPVCDDELCVNDKPHGKGGNAMPVEKQECEHKNTFTSVSTTKGTRKICHDCNLVLPKPQPVAPVIEELKVHVSFGVGPASWTDVHNALVPYYKKLQEVIKAVNALARINK